jgi:CBS domain-containing protein
LRAGRPAVPAAGAARLANRSSGAATMAEDSLFFRPVKEHCQRAVVACAPDDALVDVAKTMREKNISSVLVCENKLPSGIFTDRDLRNKVVAAGTDPSTLRVRDVMHSPLSLIGENAPLYEALYRMSREGIHRLAVVDGKGKLAGIITDGDILRLQSHSPHQLVLDIERAKDRDELKAVYGRIQRLVLHLSGTGIGTREMVRMIAHLNDQILLRLIALLCQDRFADLPARFAFVVLGSEGRGEQTLLTDQDNAIVYGDELGADKIRKIEKFAKELIDSLIAIGIPPCPGGIMANNEEWRRSVGKWSEQLDRWLQAPRPAHVLSCGTFVDIRTIYGDPSFEQDLKKQLYDHVKRDKLFLMRMVENTLRFVPPIGWFGRIKGEKDGEHSGMLEIKKAGIFAISEGVKALAIQAGKLKGSTHQRLEALVKDKVVNKKMAETIAESFDFLVLMRLRGQVEAVREGRKPDNYIPLERLNMMEIGRLQIALKGVEKFQEFIKGHFNLHLLR